MPVCRGGAGWQQRDGDRSRNPGEERRQDGSQACSPPAGNRVHQPDSQQIRPRVRRSQNLNAEAQRAQSKAKLIFFSPAASKFFLFRSSPSFSSFPSSASSLLPRFSASILPPCPTLP